MIAPAATRPLARVAFALWVSICAAAPEFIWQGLLQLGGHLTLLNLYAVVLIGPILAFFVEPLLQRFRSRRWDVDEHGGQGVLPSVVLALAFGVAAVAVHECMNAYVGGTEHLQSQRQESLREAVKLILQWALVPFAVTLAWFAARRGRLFGWYASALAFLWAVAVGWYYEWDWRDIAMSALPGGLIAVFGVRRIARDWSHDTFRKLAFGTGLVVLGFASIGLLVQLPLSLAGVTSWHVYNFRELFEDLRFYLGWVLGLLIAPNPVPEELSGPRRPPAVDTFGTRLLLCGAMPSASALTPLQCLRCRAVYGDQRLFTGCPRCARESVNVNLSVVLDHATLGPLTPATFPATPRSLWRFRQLLPLRDANPVSLGEGATPLIHLERLGRRLGLPRLYAKDESQNPTWSYKDRLCSLAVTHAVATGARVITISSTGNHGASTAAYAARAGLPCVIFTVASVPDTMKTLMQAYGAAVVACPTSESRWALMKEGIERHGWYPTSGWSVPPIGSNPFGIEGYKTIACEIAEDLDWTAPDVVAVPSCYSDGLYGIWKGWVELAALGLVKARPRMLAAEPFGPLGHALAQGLEAPQKVTPGSSVAFSIASPYGTYQGLAALRESGGLGVPITDEGIFEAQRALAGEEGVYAEPSAIVGLTAVVQLARQKAIAPDQVVAVVLTSGGLKDYGASRAWLPPVPSAGADFDSTLRILEDSYGLGLGA